MPVLTPNYLLPVPGPLDAPCDFATQWCAFVAATQAVLDGFEAVADRTNPVVPLAKLVLDTPVTLPSNSAVPFNTLTLNNANMVDFDNNNTTITIRRPGRYSVIFNVLYASSAAANSIFVNQLTPVGGGTVQPIPAITYELDIGTNGTPVGCNLTGVIHVTTPPVSVSTIVQLTSGANMTVNSAALSVFWYADRDTP